VRQSKIKKGLSNFKIFLKNCQGIMRKIGQENSACRTDPRPSNVDIGPWDESLQKCVQGRRFCDMDDAGTEFE
jgi:hypothetical protein